MTLGRSAENWNSGSLFLMILSDLFSCILRRAEESLRKGLHPNTLAHWAVPPWDLLEVLHSSAPSISDGEQPANKTGISNQVP